MTMGTRSHAPSGNTFFYGGEPGLLRGEMVLPSSDVGRVLGRITSVIPPCPSGKFFIADDVPSALFVAAALQQRDDLALYEVSPIGGTDEADPRYLANCSFVGLSVKLCSKAHVLNQVELPAELIVKIREMIAAPEKSIANFAERTASARRKYNLTNLQKNMERKGVARGTFLKKQIKLRRAKARGKK